MPSRTLRAAWLVVLVALLPDPVVASPQACLGRFQAWPKEARDRLVSSIDREACRAASRCMARLGVRPEDLPPALLYGYALCEPRPVVAVAHLEQVARSGCPVAALALAEVARRLAMNDDPAAALERLEALDAIPGAGVLVLASAPVRASVLRELGRPGALVGFLTRVEPDLWRGLDVDDALEDGIWAARRVGRDDLVDRWTARLLDEYPESKAARRVMKGLPLRRRLLHLATHYPTGRRGRRALKLALGWASLAQGKESAPFALELVKATSMLRGGAYRYAVDAFDRLLAKGPDSLVAGLAMWGRATALRRMDLDLEASATYRALGRWLPGHPKAPDALAEAAYLARLHDEDGLAALDYRALVAMEAPARARAGARWGLGWLALRHGRFDEAREHLERLLVEHGGQDSWSRGGVAERGTYWLARLDEFEGNVAQARARYRRLVETWPLSYFGAMAWSRLGSTRPHPTMPPVPWGSLLSPPASRPELESALELERFGLYRLARRHLRALLRAGHLTPREVDHLAALHMRAGDVTLAYLTERYFGSFDRWPESPGAWARWYLFYPKPFARSVEYWAGRHGLDPYLVWAVMRQESGFHTKARSPARALGLMQLILVTARTMAPGSVRIRREEDLYDPDTNIRLGCLFLDHLLDRFHGNVALALAAYNAGPGYARRWGERWGERPVDELAEEIPVRRTHGYVKQVLQSWATYRYLYGEAGPSAPWLDGARLDTERGGD